MSHPASGPYMYLHSESVSASRCARIPSLLTSRLVSGVGSIIELTMLPANQAVFFMSSLKAWLIAFWVQSVVTQTIATGLIGTHHLICVPERTLTRALAKRGRSGPRSHGVRDGLAVVNGTLYWSLSSPVPCTASGPSSYLFSISKARISAQLSQGCSGS